MQKKFRLQLSFKSVLSLSCLIGFCAAIVYTPVILVEFGVGGGMRLSTFLLLLFLTPLSGALQGLLSGFLAYPLYFYLTSRIGFRYEGKLYVDGSTNIGPPQ